MEIKYEVSLIVPVYNGERYIKQCLDSVCAQTVFDLIEIILINDGSTDNTPIICDGYAKKYENIRVIHQENRGLVASRKVGTKAASAKYITFVDADDWIDSNYVECLLNAMKENNCDLVISDMKYEFDSYSKNYEGAIPAGLYKDQELSEFKNKYIYSDKFFSFGSCVCVWGKLFVLEKYRKYQYAVPNGLKIGEDVAVSVPYVVHMTGTVTQLSNVFYHYRQVENSMVHNHTNPTREKETKEFYTCLDKSVGTDSEVGQRLNYYKASMLIGLMKNNCNLKSNMMQKVSEIHRLVNIPENREVVSGIKFKTLGLKYKIFFTCVKWKLSFLTALMVVLIS